YHGRVGSSRVSFFFDYLYQLLCAIGIAGKGARGGAHGVSVYLHGFLLDVLIRYETSVVAAALDGLLVEVAIAALRVTFDGADGIGIAVARVSGRSPVCVRRVGLGRGGLRP